MSDSKSDSSQAEKETKSELSTDETNDNIHIDASTDLDTIILTSSSLSDYSPHKLVSSPNAGGIATFVGVTRDHFNGRPVRRLEYHAYPAMAVKQLQHICTVIRSRWSVCRVSLVHRVGRVDIECQSVIVAVSAVHRREALEACEFGINSIKQRVPIWKKEFYGEIPCSSTCTLCDINYQQRDTKTPNHEHCMCNTNTNSNHKHDKHRNQKNSSTNDNHLHSHNNDHVDHSNSKHTNTNSKVDDKVVSENERQGEWKANSEWSRSALINN